MLRIGTTRGRRGTCRPGHGRDTSTAGSAEADLAERMYAHAFLEHVNRIGDNAERSKAGLPIKRAERRTVPSAGELRSMLQPRQRRGPSPRNIMRRLVALRHWTLMAHAGVAVHEAAHAVVALDQGILPLSAAISQDGSGAARHCKNLYAAEAVAVMALAGALAESRLRDEAGQYAACVPSIDDEKLIPYSGAERQRLTRIAAERVDELWFPIRAIARELLIVNRLAAADIIRLARPWKAFFGDSSRF